jgi:hypothetical protein
MSTTFHDSLTSPHHWGALAVTLLLVVLTASLHYESLQLLSRWMPRWTLPRRPRILVMILWIIAMHVAEIWLFGVAVFLLVQAPSFGGIVGIDAVSLLDAVYVSAMTYSTVGYGDLVPAGPVRFLLGTEAIVGLVMISWSASFAYLEMGRYWKSGD